MTRFGLTAVLLVRVIGAEVTGGVDLNFLLNLGTLGVLTVLWITGRVSRTAEVDTWRAEAEKARQEAADARAETAKVKDLMIGEFVPTMTRLLDAVTKTANTLAKDAL